MTISNMTLVKIAALGGIATVTMGLMARFKIEGNIKETSFYKEALKAVRTHPGAVHLLGEPIKDRSIDVGDEDKNFCKENKAQYEIPLKGPKQRGKLYLWASRKNEDAPWELNKLELELGKNSDKRLVIKKVKNIS